MRLLGSRCRIAEALAPLAACRRAADVRHVGQRGAEVREKQQKAAVSHEEHVAQKQQQVGGVGSPSCIYHQCA